MVVYGSCFYRRRAPNKNGPLKVALTRAGLTTVALTATLATLASGGFLGAPLMAGMTKLFALLAAKSTAVSTALGGGVPLGGGAITAASIKSAIASLGGAGPVAGIIMEWVADSHNEYTDTYSRGWKPLGEDYIEVRGGILGDVYSDVPKPIEIAQTKRDDFLKLRITAIKPPMRKDPR